MNLAALIGHDERERCEVQKNLERLGYQSLDFSSDESFLKIQKVGIRFSLRVFIVPPEMDWEKFSQESNIPTLLIGKNLKEDFLLKMNEGGWRQKTMDLISLPFSEMEFGWRVNSLVGRHGGSHEASAALEDVYCGEYRISARQRTMELRGVKIPLKPREFDLAMFLFRNIDQEVTREILWTTLWGISATSESRALDACIASVRKKLQLNPDNGVILRTIYCRGYQLLATK